MVIPYYLLKERRQEIGFEGENLENQKRSKIIANSAYIKAEHVQQKFPDTGNNSLLCYIFLVHSASQPGHWYEVDLRAYTCTCLDYPAICFCKHIHAVQTHFPFVQPLEIIPRASHSTSSGKSDITHSLNFTRLIFPSSRL